MNKDNIQEVIKTIQKRFGKSSINFMSDIEPIKVEVIPTGLLKLDNATQIGGFPKSRISLIAGRESLGKSLISTMAIAECQKMGGVAALIDAEATFADDFAELQGVNIDDLVYSKPETAEIALSIIEDLVKSKSIDLVILDSISALVPKQEVEGDLADANMALTARIMSKFCRRITQPLSESHTALVLVSQLRSNIGDTYNPTVISGGMALKFYASIVLELTKGAYIKADSENIGTKVIFKITKNKLGTPHKKAEITNIFGKGFSRYSEIIDLATETGLIKKAGAWLNFTDETICNEKFQGQANLETFLRENDKVYIKLRNEIKTLMGLQ